MNEYIPFVVVVRPIECELEILVLVRTPARQLATDQRNTWCFTSNSFEGAMAGYYVRCWGRIAVQGLPGSTDPGCPDVIEHLALLRP